MKQQWSHGLRALTSAGADHVADPSWAVFKPWSFSSAPQTGTMILGKILKPCKMQSNIKQIALAIRDCLFLNKHVYAHKQ